MSGFVATNQPADSSPIANDGFFPDIDPTDFRAATRQDGTVTESRLAAALTAAMDEANQELAEYRTHQQAAGHTTLADVPEPGSLGGESIQLIRYRRAVYSLAKAALLEHYRDFDATRSGQARAEDQPDAEAIYRREARWAIADLLGQPRLVAELI